MTVKRLLIGTNRLVVIVVHWHPQLVLYLRRLPTDLTIYVDITVDDFHSFSGLAYQTLNVVYWWIQRILEDYYVPAFGFEELIDAFQHQYPVPACYRYASPRQLLVTAAWTTSVN